MSRGWAKASACRLQMTLSCAVLCHIVSLQYLSRSSLHRLAGLPCRLFLSYGLQVVTRDVHRSEFCPLPDPDGGLSILVCDVEHTSFHFGLCGRSPNVSFKPPANIPHFQRSLHVTRPSHNLLTVGTFPADLES